MAAETSMESLHSGQPPELVRREPPRLSTLLRVCPYILGNEFCERIAYYGLAINLVNYMTNVMGIPDGESAMQVMLFQGTAYITPLFGAYLADSHWGRYKTILSFSAIYCVGMICMAAQAAIPDLRPSDPSKECATMGQLAALYGVLYIIALGTGGIKPNVAAFGADQFDELDPRDVVSKKSFFMWFYFTVNCGSLIGTTVVVYVQENISWSIGYAIPAICLFLAICSFVVGSPLYKHVHPAGSPFIRIYQVIASAFRNRNVTHGMSEIGNQSADLHSLLLEQNNHLQRHEQQQIIDTNSSYMRKASQDVASNDGLSWLDKATLRTGHTQSFSPKQVDEVRLVLRMLPVFFTTVLYATVYAQFSSFFILQGDKMNRTVVGHNIPAASLTLFDTLSIIILVPAYEHLLMPCLGYLNRQPTMLQRIGWGMVVAVLAMVAAACVETKRKAAHFENGHAISVFWQIPQYTLIGASEVLCMVGQLEFFYDQAPDVMRSMGMAMQMLSISLGSYLSGTLTAIIRTATSVPGSPGGWLPKDLNYGELDKFFLLLAGLMSANLLVFVWIASNYVYKTVPHRQYHVTTSMSEGGQHDANHAMTGSAPGINSSGAISIVRRNSTEYHSGRGTQQQNIPAPEVPSDASDPYSRSITVVPQSMVLPAPMR